MRSCKQCQDYGARAIWHKGCYLKIYKQLFVGCLPHARHSPGGWDTNTLALWMELKTDKLLARRRRTQASLEHTELKLEAGAGLKIRFTKGFGGGGLRRSLILCP